MDVIKPLVRQNKIVSIEKKSFILDGRIQPVYKYYIDGMLVLTFYTNGFTKILYPVYYKLDIWSKKKLDDLLEGILPSSV